MAERNDVPTFKLVVVGDRGVGKTVWCERVRNGEFSKKYIPTLGADFHSLPVYTNFGRLRFDIWDCAGQDILRDPIDGYLVNAQCAVIMFDMTSKLTYDNVAKWHREIIRMCGNIPIVLCGNKVEVQECKVKAKDITFHREHTLQYYDISAKSGYNLFKPLEWLARKLTGASKLMFLKQERLVTEPGITGDSKPLHQLGNDTDVAQYSCSGSQSLHSDDHEDHDRTGDVEAKALLGASGETCVAQPSKDLLAMLRSELSSIQNQLAHQERLLQKHQTTTCWCSKTQDWIGSSIVLGFACICLLVLPNVRSLGS